MRKFAKDLIQSLTEAVEHAEGKAGTVRVQVIEVRDVRAQSAAYLQAIAKRLSEVKEALIS